MAEATLTKTKKGVITQIVGVVVDVEFETNLPSIYHALTVDLNGKTLTLEVAQHLSQRAVRAIALGPTDGLARGAAVSDTGAPISVPIGDKTLGRMFNVFGEPIDGKPAVKDAKLGPIHRDPPSLIDQNPKVEILETGMSAPVRVTTFTTRWPSPVCWIKPAWSLDK
jgi:F-type H+-transporting ATPase subunit beta